MARRLQVAVRRSPRTQMPLLGDKFRITTSLRVPLGLWQWPWLIKACLYSDRLWSNLTSGTPATAVRFGNRPAPSAGRHLTGQKGFPGRPLRSPSRGYFYKLRASRSVVVNLSLSRRNAASEAEAACVLFYAAWAPCIWYGYCMMPVAMARAASSRWAS